MLIEHKVTATGPARASGGAGCTTTADQKVLQEHKVIRVLNEITLTPQGAQKQLLRLNEITLTPQGAQKLLLLLKETLVTTRSRRCYRSEGRTGAQGAEGATAAQGDTGAQGAQGATHQEVVQVLSPGAQGDSHWTSRSHSRCWAHHKVQHIIRCWRSRRCSCCSRSRRC